MIQYEVFVTIEESFNIYQSHKKQYLSSSYLDLNCTEIVDYDLDFPIHTLRIKPNNSIAMYTLYESIVITHI